MSLKSCCPRRPLGPSGLSRIQRCYIYFKTLCHFLIHALREGFSATKTQHRSEACDSLQEWLVEEGLHHQCGAVHCVLRRWAVPPLGYFTLYTCFSINLKNMVKPKDVVNIAVLFPSCSSVVYWYSCVFIIIDLY
jgi:hypothetical protein